MSDSFVYRVNTCYGLDLSANRLVIVKSTRPRRGGAEHTLVCDCPPQVTDLEILEGIQKEVVEGHAATVACMPSSESFARWLQTPLSSLVKARRIAPSLLDIQLPFPLEDCTYAMVRFRKSSDGKFDALAVAARTRDIASRLDLFRRAGIEPMRMDHEALVLWAQSLREIPAERNAIRVVAFIGVDHSTLVFGCGSDFLSVQSIRVGANELEALQSEPARRFALRAQQQLRAHVTKPGDSTLQWIWTGPAVLQTFKQTLEDTLRSFDGIRFLTVHDPSKFLARAVADNALASDSLSCNFRIGPLAHPEDSRHRRRQKFRVAFVILVAGLLLVGLNMGWRLLLARQKETIQEKLTSLAQELSRISRVPRGQEVLVAERAVQEQAPLVAPFLEAFEPSLTTLLAELVSLAHKRHMTIEVLSLKKDTVSIRGAAVEWSEGERLVDLLRGRGFTANIQRQDAGADERVHFTIRAQMLASRETIP